MVAANGARFHVASTGDGPLVLLVHGFPEFWWAWRHQMVPLAAAGYRAAAMDLRGYGGSDKPPRGYDPFTLAADVAGVIRSLGARDAVVVGHGWGGLAAWTVATLHPEQVRGIAIVSMPHPRRLRLSHLADPAQLRASRHVLGFQRPILPERALVAHDGALVVRLLRLWSAPGGTDSGREDSGWPDPESEHRYRQAIQIAGVAHSSLEAFRWAVRSLPRADGLRFARRMKAPVVVPTLQVHGALDRAVFARSAQGSGRYVDAPYRWHLLPQTGHFPHEEDPTAFTDVLLEWLRSSVLGGPQ